MVLPIWVQPALPSGERWILYAVAPLEPIQLRFMAVASSALALSPVGGAGGGGAPPSRTPARTALGPAVRVTVMVTVPPAATLIGRLTQAPCEKGWRVPPRPGLGRESSRRRRQQPTPADA